MKFEFLVRILKSCIRKKWIGFSSLKNLRCFNESKCEYFRKGCMIEFRLVRWKCAYA